MKSRLCKAFCYTNDSNYVKQLRGLFKWILLTFFSWYVLETNYDPWDLPPSYDDRRDAGIEAMEKAGKKKMTPRSLYEVL